MEPDAASANRMCSAVTQIGVLHRFECNRPLGHDGPHYDLGEGFWWGEGDPPGDATEWRPGR